jgi:cholesterol transport system auxiliary component
MKPVILTGLLASAVLLSACLPGRGPRPQMYRFGAADAPATQPSSTVVQLNALTLQPAAQGDRLLAVNGPQAFYISQSRWVSPAEDLLLQAADRAFDRAGLNLIRRGGAETPVANLNLNVPVFEARYLAGLEAAPTVVVEVEASMASTTGERGSLGSTRAVATVPATANTVTAIVAAYDAATQQALDQAAGWAAGQSRGRPAR